MTRVEDRLREELAGPAWDVPVPPDPTAWVAQRVSRDRRRRAVLVLPLAAALVAATAGLAPAMLNGNRPGGGQVAAQPGEWTASRDGLDLTVRLSDSTPAVGERVSGTLTVANSRTDAVQFLDPCGRAPTLNLDYSGLVAVPPGPRTDPTAEFVQRVTGTVKPDAEEGFFAPALRTYQVANPTTERCGPDEAARTLAAGASVVRDVAWTIQSPNGAGVNATLPARAIFAYILPAPPDGTPVQGDPDSRGSTTPSARSLDLRFALSLHGGNARRPGIGGIAQSAASEPAFAEVLRRQPVNSWQFGWVLTTDKISTENAISFDENDTNPMLDPAPSWFVAVVYATPEGRFRATATVDGATAKVLSVNTRSEGSG